MDDVAHAAQPSTVHCVVSVFMSTRWFGVEIMKCIG